MIPIFDPYLSGNEKKYLKECLKNNWISSQGSYVKKFENKLARYHKSKHAIATSSCTSALHLSLKVLKIGYGDEVICPALTFIAPVNMIILSGAKPILVDIDNETLNIDPNLIEKKITKKTKAILVVHQFGHACDMDKILKISKKYKLKIIEDNAESIGGKYKNKLLGTIGDISTFSFFANKIITTGEGGAILTNNRNIAIKCKELRDHGMDHKRKYYHTRLGYNYRMTNMQAAIGLGQIENLNKILKLRNKQMNYYYKLLENNKNIKLRKFYNWCTPVHWLMTITLNDNYDRDNFIIYMKNKGIDCRQMINPVNQAKHFIEYYGNKLYKKSEIISKKSLHLPSSGNLKIDQINKICKLVNNYFK